MLPSQHAHRGSLPNFCNWISEKGTHYIKSHNCILALTGQPYILSIVGPPRMLVNTVYLVQSFGLCFVKRNCSPINSAGNSWDSLWESETRKPTEPQLLSQSLWGRKPSHLCTFPSYMFPCFVTALCACAQLFQSCPTLHGPVDHSQPGSSVHRFFPARVLEWFARPSSRGSSQPRDGTPVFCTTGRFFTSESPGFSTA